MFYKLVNFSLFLLKTMTDTKSDMPQMTSFVYIRKNIIRKGEYVGHLYFLLLPQHLNSFFLRKFRIVC